MNKRKLAWISVIVLGVLAVVGLCTVFNKHTVTFSEQDIQQKINAQLSKDRRNQTINVRNLRIKFLNDQIHLNLDMEGKKLGQPFEINVFTIGTPQYDSRKGEFYFRPQSITIESFTFKRSGSISNAIAGSAERYVSNKGLKNLVTDAAPKVEDWIKTTAEKASIFTLEHMPVYRLKDDVKSDVARAVLESVDIDGDKLVVTFSFLQLTKFVGAGILGVFVVIAIMTMLIMDPKWGLVSVIAEGLVSFP
jgi:hypothetical protein